MTALAWLVPAALSLGLLALAGFVWALTSGQFDDLDGAAWRALEDDGAEREVVASAELETKDQIADATISGSTSNATKSR